MKKVSIFVLLTLLIFLCSGIVFAESVTLPKNLKEIGAKAFYKDTSVTRVVVPDGVTSIGSLAFAFSGLTDITIPASVTSISETAFLGTKGLAIHAPDGSYAAEYAEAHKEGYFLAVGSLITFGNYPQTADGDIQPIEWLVLDSTEDSVLLLSRYGLHCQPYNTEYTEVTWSTCTLRTWLNKDFLGAAFTEEEQAAILTTTVDNSQSQHYSGYSDTYKSYANTSDKIFLLSYAEAYKYFGVTLGNTSNMSSRAESTAYAVAQGAYYTSDGNGACWWWLRSPGGISHYAANVRADGSLGYDNVDDSYYAVRPALWVNLEFLF